MTIGDEVTQQLTRTIRLRRDATCFSDIDRNLWVVRTAAASLAPRGLQPGATRALRALAEGPSSEPALSSIVLSVDGTEGLLRWQMWLRRLESGGWIESSVAWEAEPLAALVPLGHSNTRPTDALDASTPVRLSRFSAIRPVDGALLVESPRSTAAVEALDPRVGMLLARLARPVSSTDPLEACGLAPPAVMAVLGLLDSAGLLTHLTGTLEDPEETEQRLAHWSPPDLWLHANSRHGRRARSYGGSYPFSGRFPPVPAVPAARPGDALALPAVDLEQIERSDRPFTSVLESRQSLRAHDDEHPITVQQLGELLYRSARCRRVIPAGEDVLLDRPYPAGGALHELELYPLVSRCAGLEPGLYHYAGDRHVLEPVSEYESPAVRQLVAHARAASTVEADPQVVLIAAARFGRVMWKYESVCYSLVLKHVGVLYQTLYLVATAMGLAGCALGGGDADLFATATGLDYYVEGSVGEFLLGAPAPVQPRSGAH